MKYARSGPMVAVQVPGRPDCGACREAAGSGRGLVAVGLRVAVKPPPLDHPGRPGRWRAAGDHPVVLGRGRPVSRGNAGGPTPRPAGRPAGRHRGPADGVGPGGGGAGREGSPPKPPGPRAPPEARRTGGTAGDPGPGPDPGPVRDRRRSHPWLWPWP
ncbi:hypothetical protein LT493_02855 [Streptomyces tricolor]|nr:hypothetical protein [Streptomyces tricolor]